MSDDLLDAFQRGASGAAPRPTGDAPAPHLTLAKDGPVAPPATGPAPAAKEEDHGCFALGPAGTQPGIEVWLNPDGNGPDCQSVAYLGSGDDTTDTHMSLLYTWGAVMIEGRGLLRLRSLISRRRVILIRQGKSPDGTVMISRIEVSRHQLRRPTDRI